ncbi:TPA: type VI secretion protein [Klebsiella pneumoniae]|uniref:type VI secretion system-associated protein TagO n=1 Tax=Klebsiella pneumoniae complex TaxID=3390273 RepID=UPI00044DFDAE|nr:MULTISPECIES: type VI secretion system-associated protein TagO [Klebsiella]HCB0075971.1 type VI secretion protein [Klebsiella variicola subsp. variicola]EIW9288452.1 type VI secretion protein [Klebsiella pneumoniae]EKU2151368.1 type VI secretion protein [Klebsiella pneumoniae]EKV0525023.1 type VI secretion protein [Klebsiella pneumoniae]EKV0538978.1 type VI secretion protein [Klebsiella pneumoniae]
MKKSFIFIATFLAASVSLATHAQEESRDFKGVLQCRTIEDSSLRLSCYDHSIPPSRTKSAEKFESREQCPDEKTDERRLTCYDRFFSPTFKPVSSAKNAPLDAEVAKNEEISKEKVLECRSELNGTKRLACYDKLFPQDAAEEDEPAVAEATPNPGKWLTHITTSPVDDSKNVVLMLPSNDSIRTPFGETVTPTIFVACREKKTEVFINWDVYLGLEETSMLYRLDKQKAVERSWSISTDTKAVFYSGRDIDFVKALAKSEKMFARITPYNESPVSVTFELTGLNNALKPLQQACGWK